MMVMGSDGVSDGVMMGSGHDGVIMMGSGLTF